MARYTRVLATRWHRDAPVMQLLLEHRDCRLGIALLTLGDCDGSRDADREAAARGPGAVLPERALPPGTTEVGARWGRRFARIAVARVVIVAGCAVRFMSAKR